MWQLYGSKLDEKTDTISDDCGHPDRVRSFPRRRKCRERFRQITAAEAVSLMEAEENYIILDVRTQAEYEEKHIPGAICIPNKTIGSDEIKELPDKDQLILVYCRSGNRSKQASEKPAALGYANIVEFGGINDWPGETVSGNG